MASIHKPTSRQRTVNGPGQFELLVSSLPKDIRTRAGVYRIQAHSRLRTVFSSGFCLFVSLNQNQRDIHWLWEEMRESI